jgi:hypothetical protein
MIEKIITKELHACDICKRRIPSTSPRLCILCKKEVCQYCRILLIRSKRKHPDSGYYIVHQNKGVLCLNCAKKKLKIKVE